MDRAYQLERKNIKNKDDITHIRNVYGFGHKKILELKTNYNIRDILAQELR